MRQDIDNIALIKQAMSLARTLIELKDLYVRIGSSSPSSYPGFLLVGTDDRDSESCYYLNEKTGQVLYNTWKISGHNGDSFGHEYTILSSEEAHDVLKGMCMGFVYRGIELEKRLKEAELRRQETQELRDKFLSRVK